MNLKKLSNYLELTLNKKIKISRLENVFDKFYNNSFNYDLFKNKYGDLADKIELFNEDLSRFERLKGLRNESVNYYINENQLIDIIKMFKIDIDEVLK